MPQFTLESLPDTAAAPRGGFVLESLPDAPTSGVLDTALDVAKAAGSGAVRGVAMIPGVVGDAAGGIEWLAEKIARRAFGDEQVDKVKAQRAADGGSDMVDRAFRQNVPTSDSMQKRAREYVPGADYDPKTTAGEYARTVGEFAPTAALPTGAEGLLSRVAKYAVGAGVASEAAGQATEGTKYEPYARAVGAIIGGAAPSVVQAVRPGTSQAEALLRDALRGTTREQFDDAARRMEQARTQGVPLTWAEAIEAAKGQTAGPMAKLQRTVENEAGGGQVLGPMMAERAGNVDAAVRGQLDQIAPQPGNVSMVGPNARDAAEAEINRVRREDVNAPTQPMYDAARADRIAPWQMVQLEQTPGYEEALRVVRNDPMLNRDIANLPDNSVAVVDKVEQQLRERGNALADPLNPDRSQTRASGYQRSAAEVRDAATSASASLDDARRENARLRAENLRPLQEGQLGQVAAAGDTRAAGQALLPAQPLPGLARETADTTAALMRQNPEAARALVRTRLEDQFNQSSRDLQGGPNAQGGAKFRRDVYGTQEMRENVGAALRGLPGGDDIARGFGELMETLEATGKRLAEGSSTAATTDMRRQLQGGSVAGEALSSVGQPAQLGAFARERYKDWQRGRNSRQLAEFLMDPDNQQRLVELANMRRDAPRRAALQAALVSSIVGSEDEVRYPPLEVTITPRQELIDAMANRRN